MTKETTYCSYAELKLAAAIREVLKEKASELSNTNLDFEIAKVVLKNDPLREKLGGTGGEEWVYNQKDGFINRMRKSSSMIVPLHPNETDDLANILFHCKDASIVGTEHLETYVFGEDYSLWPGWQETYFDSYDFSITLDKMKPGYIPTKEQLEKLYRLGFLTLYVKYDDGSRNSYRLDAELVV